MSAISVKQFGGIKPIVSARLLGASEAQVALNAKLVSGSLLPMKGTTTLQALQTSNPATIYRYGTSSNESNYWLEFSQDTDVMRSPIAQDPYDRLYWTNGSGAPRYAPNDMILGGGSGAYPRGSYLLGIPSPGYKPSVSGTSPASTSTNFETRTYVYTYVSAYGEEGPPSEASITATIDPTFSVTIDGMSTAPSGAYNITTKRIYRSSAVGSSAQFQFVAEIPVANSSYTDTKTQADLGEVLPSEDWVAPPSGLKGLRMMANGAAVGFLGKTLYFSEPYLPHAWPHQYPIDYDIVGIATYGQYVAVLTTSFPYLFSGIDPAAMSSSKLSLPQACVSKRSIVETGNGVIYASPDGMVEIGTRNDVLTSGLLNREQWQSYVPSSIDAYTYNGRIHCFYNNGTRGVLVFDFTGQGATLTTNDVNNITAVTAGFYDATVDKLYLAQGSNIVRFDSGYNQTYTWKSKQFRLDYPHNFGFGQVNAYQYPVTFKVYADGVLRAAKVVQNNNQFRLPSGFRAYEWSFQLEGTGEVIEVAIADSTEELKSV